MPVSPPRFKLPPVQQALLASEYANMQACIRCGLCLPSCPTYLISMAEEEGPRGRVAMARALVEGHLELTPDLVEHENNCLLCEACTRVCPAGVRMEELGVPLRQVFEDLESRPWWQRLVRRIAFRHLFGSMPNFRRLAALVRFYQRSELQRLVRASGALRLLGLQRLEGYLPPIDRRFLVARGQTWEPNGPPAGSAALFVGCIMSTAFAETDRATARLLARAGYRVTATPDQGCCGALNAHSGDREGGRELARRNVEAFESDPEALIVANAAGCGAMLREYAHLLGDDPAFAQRAERFAARVRDVTELLAESRVWSPESHLEADSGPETSGARLVVTYQEPCHLAHAQGISRQPRELLRAAGFRLVEMRESSVCCGSAGVYNVAHPEKAGQLLDRKLDNALATGAPTIVTANPGCLLQLQAGLMERGSDVRVRHIVDLLDEACSSQADGVAEEATQRTAVARGGTRVLRRWTRRVLAEGIVRELAEIVGPDQVHGGPAELLTYSYDGTFQQHVPDLALTPGSEDEVVRIMRVAARERIPVVPRGAGTSLTGGTIPEGGGLVLSLARMNRILEIDRVDSVAVVEPGVVTAHLQAAVEEVGLFYPPDPASLQQSTIGGNVACNAGGPRCLKYGVTKDYVLGLHAVLADGRLLKCGGRLIKNVTGYQLAQLFVGSEGTLGIVTEITLRLIPRPRHRATAVALFGSLDDASRAVTAVMAAGVLPVALEMIDQTCINLVEDFLGIGLPRDAEAMLLLEADGNEEASTAADLERIAAVCRAEGATAVTAATSPAERDALWKARRSVSPALGRARPNKLGEDIVVPRSAIPAMVRRVGEISRQFDLPIPVFGHAGDGNLHPNILFDRGRPGEMERVEAAAAEIFRAALELGGTLSGEHGIGTLKREFLQDDLGEVAVSAMAQIKRSLDPHGLLNPGKVFPQRNAPGHSGFLTALPSLEGLTPG